MTRCRISSLAELGLAGASGVIPQPSTSVSVKDWAHYSLSAPFHVCIWSWARALLEGSDVGTVATAIPDHRQPTAQHLLHGANTQVYYLLLFFLALCFPTPSAPALPDCPACFFFLNYFYNAIFLLIDLFS